MKKRLIILILAATLLCGCGNYNSNEELDISYMGDYFTKINMWSDMNGHYSIMYANDTNVKYLMYSSSNRAGITPLYNSDGSLQIYGEEVY